MYYYSLHYPQMLLGCCSVIYMITVYDPNLPYRIETLCLVTVRTCLTVSCLNVCEHYSHRCASCIK